MTRSITLPGIMKSTLKIIFIIISTIVGIAVALFTWIVLKTIIRAIGWLISAATILAILYWLLM